MLPRVTRVALCTPISCIGRTLLHGCCCRRRCTVMPVDSRNGSRCSQMWCEMCCWTRFKAVGGARAVHWLPVDQCGWHCDKESGRKTEHESERKTEIERERESGGNRTERCSLSGDIYVYTNIVSFLICVTRCVFSFLFFYCRLLLTDSTKTARTVVQKWVCSKRKFDRNNCIKLKK